MNSCLAEGKGVTRHHRSSAGYWPACRCEPRSSILAVEEGKTAGTSVDWAIAPLGSIEQERCWILADNGLARWHWFKPICVLSHCGVDLSTASGRLPP